MNLLVIGIGHEKDLIIGYQYRFKFFISCIPNMYMYMYMICIYLYFYVLLLVFSVICMHQGSESNAISILCMYVRYMWEN